MTNNKEKKKKIRWKGLILILLIIYLIITFISYIYKMPIRKININGISYLKENYIINYINIKNKTIISTKTNDIKKDLLKLDLIKDVKVKKNFIGIININIEEDKILFLNNITNKIVLGSGKEITNNKEFLGLPVLINVVPNDIYKSLINKLSLINNEVLEMISEIEYNPSYVIDKDTKKEVVSDINRFMFRMNDGNIVFINTVNIEKINNYITIYNAVVEKNGNKKGCLYLDSNSDNIQFNDCSGLKEVVEDESKLR